MSEEVGKYQMTAKGLELLRRIDACEDMNKVHCELIYCRGDMSPMNWLERRIMDFKLWRMVRRRTKHNARQEGEG